MTSSAEMPPQNDWRRSESVWDRICAWVFNDCRICGSIHHRTEDHDDV